MLEQISINEYSQVPKYLQIVNAILRGIKAGLIKKNDKLPSVNDLLIEFDISRDTIVKAYEQLKTENIIHSVPGKGYYIKSDLSKIKAHVFLLFNKLSPHKKIIYDAFAQELGSDAIIDFFIYENNYARYKDLILESKNRDFSHYVIINHFEEGGDDLIPFLTEHISFDKLIVLDKKLNGISDQVKCVYQDFEQNIYDALLELNSDLKKYNKLILIFNSPSYHPQEIKYGFLRYCEDYAFDSKVVSTSTNIKIESETAYINLSELELVDLIKKIKNSSFKLGEDVGVISYNDTPLKEILLDGITVISTDFNQLGKSAAQLTLGNLEVNFDNPFYVIKRKSI